MPHPETIFKPKYTGSMRFSIYLYPVWVGLFVYFVYQFIVTKSFNPQGFLAVIFGLMAFSLPFRVFREIRFTDQITVKRYLLPDFVFQYKEITELSSFELKVGKSGVPLLMMTQKSFSELEDTLRDRLKERKIKLKKK